MFVVCFHIAFAKIKSTVRHRVEGHIEGLSKITNWGSAFH